MQHDVTAEDSWQALLADVLKREGRLDIMVNNAGISGGAGSVESTDVENWQRVQAVNSEGVFLGCKYAIQGMKRTGPDKPEVQGLDRQHLVGRGPAWPARARSPTRRARARFGS